jgi:uncharacterized membrane protein
VRRRYLDWLRGIAVLIMIEAHTVDSWTQPSLHSTKAFAWAQMVGGFGAPIFLFLAGIALALAAGSRVRRGLRPDEAAARARRRGWQIFGLAFLFRLQSYVISGGGAFPRTLLKVDILNIMGPAMLLAAIIWQFGRGTRGRMLLAAAATCALAMLTPLVRQSTLIGVLPDPLEWYLRPSPGRTTFTLFPWAGFLVAGTAIGVWLERVRDPDDEWRATLVLGALGVVIGAAGYASSFLPPIYRETNFWTSSPTFFFLRLGVLMVMLPLACAWMRAWPGWSPVEKFGVASLFIYWIHVEMVYGTPTAALHGRFTLWQWPIAYVLFSAFLFLLVKLKDRLTTKRSQPALSSVHQTSG